MFGKTSASQCTRARGVAGSARDFSAASFHFLTHFRMSVDIIIIIINFYFTRDIVEKLGRSSEYVSTKR